MASRTTLRLVSLRSGRLDLSQSKLPKKKHRFHGVLSLAPRTGLEPVTSSLHFTHYFHSGVDYIFSISPKRGWNLGI